MSSAESDTRTRILQAAWRLLEEGAAGVRMSDIAKAAGVSRQAVYLHFPTRAKLLIDTTRYVDEVKNIDDRLAASRAATGIDRLDAFIQAWGDYIPEIYGISKALLAIQETDVDAAEAWRDRMRALMHGCAAAVRSLEETGQLRPDLSVGDASDLLWTLLSVRNWEHLRQDRGWSQEHYLDRTKWLAQRMLVAG
ncbi:MAG: TetR/AcrR family transcriptional regulator [Pseudomonadota bacterium]